MGDELKSAGKVAEQAGDVEWGRDVGVPSSDGHWGHRGAVPETETWEEFCFGGELFENLTGHCGLAPRRTGLGPHTCPCARRRRGQRVKVSQRPILKANSPQGRPGREGISPRGQVKQRTPTYIRFPETQPSCLESVHPDIAWAREGFGEGRQNQRDREAMFHGFIIMFT